MKKLLIAMVLALLMSGCATQTFMINGGGGEEPDQQKMQSFWVYGIGQEQEMNAAEICGGADKVAKVEAHIRFIDGFLNAITWGIYTPHTAKVYCTE
jgi:Bor protein